MYLVYIGESGNTGNSLNDSNQRHQVYAGLIIHENQYVAIDGEFNALCRRHFGEPLGGGDTPALLKPADLYQGDVYLAKRSWVDENPDLAVGFAKMLVKTLTYYVTYPAWSVDFGRENIPEIAATDREVGINTVTTNRPARSLDGLINPADIEEYIPLAQQAGLITDELDPASIDVYDIFLNEFAQAAIEEIYAEYEGTG